jgi:hypothetical protein
MQPFRRRHCALYIVRLQAFFQRQESVPYRPLRCPNPDSRAPRRARAQGNLHGPQAHGRAALCPRTRAAGRPMAAHPTTVIRTRRIVILFGESDDGSALKPGPLGSDLARGGCFAQLGVQPTRHSQRGARPHRDDRGAPHNVKSDSWNRIRGTQPKATARNQGRPSGSLSPESAAHDCTNRNCWESCDRGMDVGRYGRSRASSEERAILEFDPVCR